MKQNEGKDFLHRRKSLFLFLNETERKDVMKILFASDSFKGSLSSKRVAQLLEEAAHRVFPEAETEKVLVADGGEGTMDTVVEELHGTYREIPVKGPLGEEQRAVYGIFPGKKAVIEMAQASGLSLVPEALRNPRKTTSYGTGMLIADAMDQGIRDILIGIGGSATNDGGMGAMSALGIRFLDQNGRRLDGCGEDLGKVWSVDVSGMHPAVKETSFTVMSDVKNPLLGKDGATYTFGEQKGASEEDLKLLETGMAQYAEIAEKEMGKHTAAQAGAGAAGGLGFALLTFLDAKLKSGIETVLDIVEFDEKLKGTDLVITGEGRMDWQSSFGKVPSGVGNRCKKAGIPAAAVAGGLLEGYETIYDEGICTVMTTISGTMDLKEAMKRSEELYLDAACRLFQAISIGMKMK